MSFAVFEIQYADFLLLMNYNISNEVYFMKHYPYKG